MYAYVCLCMPMYAYVYIGNISLKIPENQLVWII